MANATLRALERRRKKAHLPSGCATLSGLHARIPTDVARRRHRNVYAFIVDACAAFIRGKSPVLLFDDL